MDSQDRDESKIRRRQESLAQRLGEALDQVAPSGAGECPDAEVMAAYAEHGLDPDEAAQWEGHFAGCARCRKILRVLAASAHTPLAEKEVAQLGELVSAASAAIEITKISAGRSRPRLVDWSTRWLAPALGVAAVLAVWFVMRPPWRATDRGASGTLVAQAPREEVPSNSAPPKTDPLARNTPPQDQKTNTGPPAARSAAPTAALNAPVQAPAKRAADASAALDKISPNATEARSSLQQNKKLDSLTEGREIQTPAAPPPLAAPSQAQAATPAPVAPQSQAKAASSAAGAVAPQAEVSANALSTAPAREKQAGSAQGAPAAALAGRVRQEALPAPPADERKEQAYVVARPVLKDFVIAKALSGSILWRAGKGGSIERSSDAGKTWISQMSPSQEDWLAGAASSETICWLAGRHGAIARTSDGERWERISPPGPAARSDGNLPDWTGITASDAQNAAVTASDGRKFATADGGKTWQPQ